MLNKNLIVALGLTSLVALSAPLIAMAQESGGRVVYAQTVDIFRFDPYDLAIGNFAMLNTVYDPIVHVDENSVPQPWLAKSWEFNEAGTELTLHLEEGVKFQSGREMTADDIKWTIEQYQDPANAAIVQKSTLLITSIEVVDPQTIVLKFDTPFATIFDLLELIFVVDRESVENLRNTPAGTGPFRLEEWDPGVEARYVRNDDYWREGEPHLDAFVQRVYTDPEAMSAAFEAGAVDIVMYPSTQDYDRLEGEAGVVGYKAYGCCEVNFNFNTANEPWDNKLVRQAINHAIDRQRLVDISFRGNSYPICQPIRSGWGHNPSLEDACAFDLDLAKSLLEEAGYGEGFEMEALVSSSVMPESTVLAQIMKDDLAKIGVTLNILDLEQTAYNNMGDKSLYKDMYIQIVGRTNKDPGSLYSLTVAFRPETNVAQFRNDEYESLIVEGLQKVDLDERTRIYQRLAEIVVEEVFSGVVAPRPELYLMTDKVQDLALSRDGMLRTGDLWLKQ